MQADPDAAERLDPADVVIVGLGAAGGIIAARLAAAGLRVVGLEAGPTLTHRDFGFDELADDFRNRLGAGKINAEVPTWRARPGDEATTSRAGRTVSLMVNGVGGGTIHYAGQHLRLAPWHFRVRSASLERYGAGALPDDSTATDWPFTYDELEPYYDAVEHELGVSGRGGVNPFEGPRSRDYPLAPLRRTGWTELVAEASRRRDLHPFAGAAAILSEPFRGQPGCTYCGFCNFNGCHADAKASTFLNVIPQAQATGHLTVVPDARVVSLPVDAEGLASGAVYLADGRAYLQSARAVVLTAHTYENTRLLLLSRSDAFPDGLANNAGQVGRNAMSHVFIGMDGVFPGRKLNRFGGTWPQCTSIDDFNADNFDHTGLGFVGGGIVNAVPEAKPIGTALSTPPSVPRWGSAWKAWLAANGNSVGRLVATVESLPYEDSFLDLDPDVVDRIGMPVIRQTYRLHEQEDRRYDHVATAMRELLLEAGAAETWPARPKLPAAPFQSVFGATRMGIDPDASVVDPFCAAHEVPNLVVVGASSFPTSGGYPPTATIQALAWRAADRLVESLR
ncbi:MAG TPA: GMC family oxidoreductase [Gaiellaceae bacterium]|jgi:gluconate 2-dehydrogenase alpha chain|nr:GMC family oxidoreductase [Gaiellaceae bacterium]